jgi:hypothetical protein
MARNKVHEKCGWLKVFGVPRGTVGYFCSASLSRSNSAYEHSLDISNSSKGGKFLGARILRPTILKS